MKFLYSNGIFHTKKDKYEENYKTLLKLSKRVLRGQKNDKNTKKNFSFDLWEPNKSPFLPKRRVPFFTKQEIFLKKFQEIS